MTRLTGAYDLGRSAGACAASGAALRPGQPCVVALCEASDGERPDAGTPFGLFLKRLDYSVEAWDAGSRPERLLFYWRTSVPESGQERRLLVDDETLLDLFLRLEADERPNRIAFRFVLGLLLVRRRLLRVVGQRHETIERTGAADGRPERIEREVWLLQPRGVESSAPPIALVNPRLREEDVCAIAEELGEIMQGRS